jgi:hypothetical protein
MERLGPGNLGLSLVCDVEAEFASRPLQVNLVYADKPDMERASSSISVSLP